MAAVVGILPEASQSSPLLYAAFALVIISILSGIAWMRYVAEVTMYSEGNALAGHGYVAMYAFLYGMAFFVVYVMWNGPPDRGWGQPDTISGQVRWAVGTLLLATMIGAAAYYFNKRRKRRRSRGEAE